MFLFFGDAHFGNRYTNREDERIELFIRFLKRHAERAQKVFIIGDLFEFWFEYRSVVPKRYFGILALLSQMADKGIEVHYFLGNHEFGDGAFFRSIGFEVHTGERVFLLDRRRVLVGHGDSADDAPATRFMNALFRSEINQFLYRLIHPDLGIELAKAVARASREKGDLHDSSGKLEAYARKRLENVDIVVFGHSHVPVLKQFAGKYYLNVGDFLNHFTYGVMEKDKVHLRKLRH